MDGFEDLLGAFDAMASKNLFTEGSSVGGDESAGRAAPQPSSGFSAFTERADVDATWGPSALGRSSRLVPFDMAAALTDRPVPFSASFNRVMESSQARSRLQGIIAHCGAGSQVESVKFALLKAILLAHAKNSGSVLQPSRAVIRVAGGKELNFYEDVVLLLGEDTRRFFRAFADMTRDVVRECYAQYEAGNMAYADDVRDLNMVVSQRGLHRFRDLVADSSDACTTLTMSEVDAIGMSKKSIFENSTNMADLVRSYRSQQKVAPSASPDVLSGPAAAQGPDY